MPIIPLGHTVIEFNPAQNFLESSIDIDSDVLKRLCSGLSLIDKHTYISQYARIYWEQGLFKISYENLDCKIIRTIGRSGNLHPDVIKLLPTWQIRLSPTALQKPLSTFKKNVKIRMLEESQAGWTAMTVDGKNLQRYPVDIISEPHQFYLPRHPAHDERAMLISYSEFIEALDTVEDFTNTSASNHDVRSSWIYLKIDKGVASFLATDSKRAIVHNPKTVWVTDECKSTYVPIWFKKAAELLIMSSDSARDCVLSVIPVMTEDDKEISSVRITGGECEIVYTANLSGMHSHDTIERSIVASLPDKERRETVDVNRKDIERFLKLAKPFKLKYEDISFKHLNGVWSLYRANDELGEIDLKINVGDSCVPMREGLLMKMNGTYLKDAIDSLYKKEKGVEQRVSITYGNNPSGFFILSNGKTSTVIAGLK
jgi:DNA polymerase III sliding clamp (beta) subunit (PCNA family)